ncbi:hypothetical protein [Streptomyces sp. WM6378]|uniref:hypothetical protein n=1 Tax=Streptomyces sp. WM6378 TaxID=1415557 RepID=UPI0006AEECED|nr:hypothetical protein [Streptomyces sp. WM6378]KOU50121.1 hypothetical protein ADK54_10235 [Streptomyces sp. WM6378]
MPVSLATDPNTPGPTARQRTWLFAALRADDGLMPLGVPHRSLDLMRERGWLQFAPATDDDPLQARHVLTAAGRFALLSVGKADALLSVLTSAEPGRIERPVQRQILTSLLREGLVRRLSRRGEQGEGQVQFTYITNLGRRLVGLPEVDDTPASDYLVAAFAAKGITVAVESDSCGDTRVVYRLGDMEARFFRKVWNPGHDTYSARHPSWMHDMPWTALITYSGDGAVEKHLPNGLGIKEESARMAAALADWLADRDDAAFAA